MIDGLLKDIEEVHVLRDPTRGGVSGTLNEIAQAAGVEIVLDEASLPIPDAVRGASEILGLDPLYIANEGLVLVICRKKRRNRHLPSCGTARKERMPPSSAVFRKRAMLWLK